MVKLWDMDETMWNDMLMLETPDSSTKQDRVLFIVANSRPRVRETLRLVLYATLRLRFGWAIASNGHRYKEI